MARLVVCALALVASGLAGPLKQSLPYKIADPKFAQRQVDTLLLQVHMHEPSPWAGSFGDVSTWNVEKNIEHFSNVTAVQICGKLFEVGLLPRGLPFSMQETTHKYEAVTLFNVLYSAKDWETFIKTAAFFRNHVNEYLFVYIFQAALVHRPDTQGIRIPAIYEIFPSFFNNGEIMTTAQRINSHGKHFVEYYPSTFVWNDDIVIRWNATTWPYYSDDISMSYFTNDYALNNFYYLSQLTYPSWLGGKTVPLVKDRRGEWFLTYHKNILARYYMERLSNNHGEIPELGVDVVDNGYTSGLLYPSGVSFPVRPNHFHLDQPLFVDAITQITDYERRIRDAIEQGYFIDDKGDQYNLRTPEAVDALGLLIEANVDSPNGHYYKDFISIWKSLLGNTIVPAHQHVKNGIDTPLVVPSVLEHYQTAHRDPAFYMIWKRVLGLYTLWKSQLPLYTHEQLVMPNIVIEKVESDKLVTYFEYAYLNVTSHLYLTEEERKAKSVDVGVLVQRAQLNHREFEVRVHVKSEVAKTVLVNFFLAPKYDSHGYEIPLHHNTENFFHFDHFTYDLPQGESVIRRKSSENRLITEEWSSSYEFFTQASKAVQTGEQCVIDQAQKFSAFPKRLLLPKGRVGGMPFVMLVYISEYRAPKVPFNTGFDSNVSLGLGSGARHLTDDPMDFPLDRPLWYWQIKDVHNLALQDVNIYHKPTPEIFVPNTY